MVLEHSPLIEGSTTTGWQIKWQEGPPRERNFLLECRLKISRFINFVKKGNVLLTLTILGIIFGIIFGCLARFGKYGEVEILVVSYPGELFMRLFKQLTLPLILSSLITGISGLDSNCSGNIRRRALVYYFSTTILAALLGIFLVITIHPGSPTLKKSVPKFIKNERASSLDTLMDLGRNMVPENLVSACFQQTRTKIVKVEDEVPYQTHNSNLSFSNLTENRYKRVQEHKDGMNILGLIVFCIAFGTICSQIGEDGQMIFRFFRAVNVAIMKLVGKVMWFMPFGIMSLIIGKIMSIKNVGETAEQLGMYLMTVIIGLAIHSFVTLPLIFFLIVRQNPYKLIKGIFQALMTALGTSSSAATLPVTFHCLEDNLHLDKRITRFVLPVGATINMDGTALYESVAAIFIAQLNGIDLSLQNIFSISLTAIAASIGAASLPSAGLITMFIVLAAAQLPVEDVSLIIAVDWLLDRLRTAINVLGDAYGAVIIHHLSKEELDLVQETNALRVELEMIEGRVDIASHS